MRYVCVCVCEWGGGGGELGSSYTCCNSNQCYSTQYFLIGCEFCQSTVKLYYLCIFFMLAKFQDDQRLIVMLSINYLNSSFYSLK